AAERKPEEAELLLGRAVEEVRLVACGIECAVQFGTGGASDSPDVVPRGETIGAELAGHSQQVGELGPHVAADAGDRRATREVVVGETLDHLVAEGAFVVEHVMREAEPIGYPARVADIVACAACALAPGSGAVVVELERH